MNIIKVDIQTGKVLENNLQEFWARRTMRRNLKVPARQPEPAPGLRPGERPLPEKVDPALMQRVTRFSSKIKRRANSWSEDELYRLAVLMGRKNMPHKQAAFRLARSPEACKYMYRKMKSAGVI